MSWFTSLRDAVESVASVATNYVYPVSGLLTEQLVSKGSQEQLGSTLGQVAMLGSGVAGGVQGNMANYGDTASGNFGNVASRTMGNLGIGAQGLDPSLVGQDPIETMNNISQSTGEQDWTKAAQKLGYSSPEQLLGSVNPSWVSSMTGNNSGLQAPGGPSGGAVPTGSGTSGFQLPSGLSGSMKSWAGSTGVQPWGSPGNLLSMGSGLYGLYQSQQLRKMAETANPWNSSGGQAMASDQLKGLLANPSSITSMPGYEAGMQAVQRSMAAQGYQGSGNMMASIAKYGGDFYNNAVAQLGGLSGASNPVAAGQMQLNANANADKLASQSLATLGYGVQRTQPNQVPSWLQ